MAKDPADRQESALQFGRQLQAARRAAGLDPGKLTVPSELALDDESLDTLTFTEAEVGDFSPTGRQAFVGRAPVEPSRPPTAAYVPEPAVEKRGKGALIAAAVVLVLVAVGIGAFAATRPRNDSVIAASTLPLPDDTVPPPAYTDDLQNKFLGACETREESTQQFCRCVFDAAKEAIPIREMLKLMKDAERPALFKLDDTPKLKEIVDTCNADVASSMTSTTPSLPPGTPS
jgi:hypothetical protein